MKNLRKTILSIAVLFTILTLFSCGVKFQQSKLATPILYGRSEGSAIQGFARNSAKMATADSYEYAMEETAVFDSGTGNTLSDRKIAKTVSINAETKTFDESIEWLKQNIESYKGIIDNSYVDSGSMDAINYRRNAQFNLRIPAEKLDSFLNQVGGKLNVTFQNESIQDVTDEYDDTDSRINTLKIEEEKLNELLKKAKTVEDMIKIEDKLSEVRLELQNITRKLARLDNRITYSQVSLYLSEVKDLTEIVEEDNFSKEHLNKQMQKNLEDTILFIKKSAAYIFIHIPAIIAILLVILILLVFVSIAKAASPKKDNNPSKTKINTVSKDDKVEADSKKSIENENKEIEDDSKKNKSNK